MEQEKERIPERIRSGFSLHDADILAFRPVGGDYEFVIANDPMDDPPLFPAKVRFRKAEIVENDGIRIGGSQFDKDDGEQDVYWFLYEELYRLEDGRYEVHMMLCKPQGDLAYLTLHCEDIEFENS